MKCAVVGYGAVGKAVEALLLEKGFKVSVFSRRGKGCGSLSPAFLPQELKKEGADLAFLCVGSAKDSFKEAPKALSRCDTIDCFDDHTNMGEYIKLLDGTAKQRGRRAVIGAGWDPGIFSVARKLFSLIDKTHTFYGEGVSLGHSNALRCVKGVADALCYTIPLEEEIEKAYAGGEVKETVYTHKRRVIILPTEGADRAQIAQEVLANPYFVGYDCRIEFCGEKAFNKHKFNRFHQGRVLCAGEGFSLTLTASMKDNAAFTAKIMTGLIGAVNKLEVGAHTLADIPVSLLSDAFY